MSKAIEKEFNCLGYFGFGAGVLMARRAPLAGEPIYCRRCPKAERCWDEHLARVKVALPGVCAVFDECAVLFKGKPHQMLAQFQKRIGQPLADPYTTGLASNLEDGALVGSGKKPADRGPLSIRYPFRKN